MAQPIGRVESKPLWPIMALEQRMSWLEWALSPDGQRVWFASDNVRRHGPAFSDVLPLYINNLRSGATFCMDPHFCRLVDVARKNVPDDLQWESTWLMARSGFLWLAEPFTVDAHLADESFKGQLRVHAIGWNTVESGTQIMTYQAFDDYKPGVKGFGCWSYWMMKEGQRCLDRVKQFEDSARASGSGFYTSDGGMREVEATHEIRWVYAAFHLMAQRLSVHVEERAPRAQRHRLERGNSPIQPLVTVITLRRMQQDRKEAGAAGQAVDWKWQWEVSGHWRNQYFKSTDSHKPVFIDAYIKGPEGRPFKEPGAKIFLAKR